jgi:hypothetical protein
MKKRILKTIGAVAVTAMMATTSLAINDCEESLLDKTIRVEGRKQFEANGDSFAKNDDSALSIEEMKRIDFSKMDFSEFIEDLKIKMVSK